MTVRILRTSDLILRPLELTDASAIPQALADWDVSRWMSAVPSPYTIDDAKYFITQIAPKDTIWAIDDETDLIGVIGVKPNLGYWLRGDLAQQRIHDPSSRGRYRMAFFANRC